jgi:hypothetical protein
MTETIVTSELYCVECGYDLRQLDSERCPECGAVIDRSVLGQSIIPWRQRARIGSLRAFWATVWLVFARPQRLAAEMNRPADLDDALKFRRIVAILAMLVLAPASMIGLSAFFGGYMYSPMFVVSDPLGMSLHALLALCILVGDWLFLITASGVASYFFHPRSLAVEQQNRAIAISYYASAPLACMPLVAAFSIAMFKLFEVVIRIRPPMYAQVTVLLLVFGTPALLLWQMWRTPVRVLRAATRCGGERQIALSLSLPLMWAALAGLFLIALPAAICMVVMMVISLW